MTIFVPIALFGWIIVALGLFLMMPARRAVLSGYIAAWLFLPQAAIPMKGLPDLDKITATSFGALLGVFLFDAGRLVRFRPSWFDIPVIIWCLASIPSALTNPPPPEGSALYDGISGVIKDSFIWGIPYFLGRLYFTDLQSLRELAVGILVGGLLYVLPCLWEVRMSPQLHHMIYGDHPSQFSQHVRYEGYRPVVFMQHGLMVAMWMASATVTCFWLWYTGALKQFQKVPTSVLAVILFVTAVLCKSMGALVLCFMAGSVLLANKYVKSSLVILLVILLSPTYMVLRTSGWDAHQISDIARAVDAERAKSLAVRLENEERLIEKAEKKPLYGWGGWGRWRVYDEFGRDITVADGMWVIARGEKGLVGLASMTVVVLLPCALLLSRVRARHWSHPAMAAPAVLAMLLVMFSIDNLLNAMLNPIYLLVAGGISSLYVTLRLNRAPLAELRM